MHILEIKYYSHHNVFSSSIVALKVHMVELVILLYLAVHLSLKFIWVGRRQPDTTLYSHMKLHFGHIIQVIIVLEMLLEVITVMFRGQTHIRLTRALRPLFVVDSVLLKGVRRYEFHMQLWMSKTP